MRGTLRRNHHAAALGRLLLGFAAACATSPTPSLAPAPAASADWLAAAQRHIAEREYRASENGSGLQAPNRAHNLRTYFGAAGVRVHDRTGAGSPELVKLSLARLGRGDALAPVATGGDPVANEARVEIRHADIVEWYVNSPAGLEQGFTLEARPSGDGPVVLELDVTGARPALRGDAVVFEAATHRKLRYGELSAIDAAGRALGARLEVSSAQRLRIVVDDADAIYPVVIDPLLTEPENLTPDAQLESDQANAGMGIGVAGAGDVNHDGYRDVIVGASGYDAGEGGEGAAFVFLGGTAGVPDGNPLTAATQLEGNQAGAALGGSVAGAGDVNGDGYDDVLVGATGYVDAYSDGAAFVFLGSASGVASGGPASAAAHLRTYVRDENPYGYGGRFGQSVAGAGDVNGDGYADVIVGDPDYDDYNPNVADHSPEGAAFVFRGSASGVAGYALIHSDIGSQWWAAINFGRSVAGAGDVNGEGYGDVVIGASGRGTAYVFHGTVSGIASGTADDAATQINGSSLGFSVAGAGDVNGDGYADVIVGAWYPYGPQEAFVFHGSVSGIPSGSATSIAATQLTGPSFGWSVAGAGDTNGDGFGDVIVGAPQYDDDPREGHVFLYGGSATGIASGGPETAAADLRAPSDAQQPSQLGLGASVAGAGDVNGDGYDDVIAGAPYYETGDTAQQSEGAAFVFLGSGAIRPGPSTTPDSLLQSDEDSARLGFSVAGAGDVDADGYSDVIVGAPYFDAGQTNEGAAFVFPGSASGVAHGSPVSAATQLESDLAFANLGESVAGAGDVNGDGYDDVIIGDPNYQNGAAFVFLGSASGVASGNPATAATRLTASPAEMPTCPTGGNAGFAVSVAGAGDVNGDGFGDVVLGAPRYPPCSSISGIVGVGAAFVYQGSATGIADATSLAASTRIEGTDQQGWLGASVAGAGDVNGDGFDDVIVGAPLYSAAGSDEGAAFVFHGSALGISSGTAATAATQLVSDQAGAQFGSSVAGAGDVNGDGYADVIVGAPSYDKNAISDTNEGAAFVLLGGASGIAATGTELISDQSHSALGVSVAGAGDVDGDQFDDVLVGASRYRVSDVESGAGFLFRGGPLGISRRIVAVFAGSQNEERVGASLASAGDVDGDGHADIIVGAPGHDAGETDEGAAFVYLPEPGFALTLASGAALLAALQRRRPVRSALRRL